MLLRKERSPKLACFSTGVIMNFLSDEDEEDEDEEDFLVAAAFFLAASHAFLFWFY
jgi:hypothetical protein